MTNEDWLTKIAIHIETIVTLQKSILTTLQPKAPNFKYDLETYFYFDWQKIQATVLTEDAQGASLVQWGGYTWTRRTDAGTYGDTVWFTRADGKDSNGKNQYIRLITFKKMPQAKPMDPRLERYKPATNPIKSEQKIVPNTPQVPPEIVENLTEKEIRKQTVTAETTRTNKVFIPHTKEDWQRMVTTAPTAELFDLAFFNLYEEWSSPSSIANIREKIGAYSSFSPPIWIEALHCFQTTFTEAVATATENISTEHEIKQIRANAMKLAVRSAKKKATDLLIEQKKSEYTPQENRSRQHLSVST